MDVAYHYLKLSSKDDDNEDENEGDDDYQHHYHQNKSHCLLIILPYKRNCAKHDTYTKTSL